MGEAAKRRSAGGPGGYWEVIDEKASPDVIRQFAGSACGPACAEMLFRVRGITEVSQQLVDEVQGMERSTGESLSAAMNIILGGLGRAGSGKWRGFLVNTLDDPMGVFNTLRERGSFITTLTCFPGELHMVVIDGLDEQDRIIVRDPYEGTRYKMTWEAFWNAWQGISVWWSDGA